MKFSILISSYNKGVYLEKCIQSCISQSNKDFEIIVADNYSSDDTENILKKYSEHIIVKKKSKISNYSAMNQIDLLQEALKISSGEIICLLDADDYFLEDKLKRLEKVFSKNIDTNVVFDKPKKLIKEKFSEFSFKKKFSNYIWPTIYPTSCISLKKKFFKNLIEKNFFEEYPLLEIDFRITVLSRMVDKKFIDMSENNTIYRQVSDGIMAKIKKFSHLWWKKRLQAHSYLEHVFNMSNLEYKRNMDYYLSKLVLNFLKIFNNKE